MFYSLLYVCVGGGGGRSKRLSNMCKGTKLANVTQGLKSEAKLLTIIPHSMHFFHFVFMLHPT